MEYIRALKKVTLPFVTTYMRPENIMLSRISHIQKYEHCPVTLVAGIQNGQTLGSRKLNGSCQWMMGRGNMGRFGSKAIKCPFFNLDKF